MKSIITQMLQMVKANANPLAWEEALQYLFQDWREELVLQALGALDKALYCIINKRAGESTAWNGGRSSLPLAS